MVDALVMAGMTGYVGEREFELGLRQLGVFRVRWQASKHQDSESFS